MGRPRKNKLVELEQIDGKDVAGVTASSLDALLGEQSGGPYTTSDEDTYRQLIAEMNSTDLDRHAQKVGLVPTHDRRVLKERLMREFNRFVNARRPMDKSLATAQRAVNDSSGGGLSAAAQKILREGA